ncbi:RICIN domain-containing protein [Actinoplanes sichuanensis]|uniref:Glycosyl hydrolase family 28-related protein n=1 Tax=Actinoplanes sichuanensis TaxID=512349 RepID=A0ABW4A0I1_9ACTN|nr:glycosyl hydrolase family 28-related protein [Actinoplanes sichuanensis]BEL07985.1 RICIN domain-containing protein [Actinoplanes sichuanensis]
MTRPRPIRRAATVALTLGLALSVAPALPAAAHGWTAGVQDLGPNVTVFDPSTPVSQIQATLDATYAKQVDNEMGTARYAYLFKPGTYGTAEQPLQIKVGYYTEIAGLGANPGDVVINGKVEAYNRCLGSDPANPNCIALVNFWRTLSNLTVNINGAGQDGCRQTANFWAVSQAVSLRRTQFTGGTLSLMDYCTAGPQYASGGFIANSKLPTTVNGSQQQWLTRNSEVESWSNAVWNQVFSGVTGAPDDSAFPNPPYTTLPTTPVSREKPFLFVDAKGKYQVRVPAAKRNTVGSSWTDTSGRTIALSDFYVAKPGDSVAKINLQLALGKNLLLTPGVYDIAQSIHVFRPNTVVLGLGHATLTAVNGSIPLDVADVPGVIVAGVTIDAGTKESPVLLRVGRQHGLGFTSAANPTTLNDVYFRVGGPHIGKTNIALEVNSDDVLIDHTWVWRGDHGVEGFTNGVNGDTDRWKTNTGRYGAVINGDDVTATGLFVEHFQKYNTVWNGERGTTVLYQNELPYDPPTQADWMNGSVEGYAGYKVGNKVKKHQLYGGGVYVFNQNNPSIHTENGFEVPNTPGVKLKHIMTVNLSAGIVDHVVNGVGEAADTTKVGQPVFVTNYPAVP